MIQLTHRQSISLSTLLVVAQRLQGRPVRFVTGTDEHGEKIAIAAAKAGVAPQEHCDGIVAQYKALWQQVAPALPPPPWSRDPTTAALASTTTYRWTQSN